MTNEELLEALNKRIDELEKRIAAMEENTKFNRSGMETLLALAEKGKKFLRIR